MAGYQNNDSNMAVRMICLVSYNRGIWGDYRAEKPSVMWQVDLKSNGIQWR